jgi:hypothetical protein
MAPSIRLSILALAAALAGCGDQSHPPLEITTRAPTGE